jgi:hypothetical protein
MRTSEFCCQVWPHYEEPQDSVVKPGYQNQYHLENFEGCDGWEAQDFVVKSGYHNWPTSKYDGILAV